MSANIKKIIQKISKKYLFQKGNRTGDKNLLNILPLRETNVTSHSPPNTNDSYVS